MTRLTFAYSVPMAIAHFISFEVFNVVDRPRGVLTPGWDRALVSVVGMKMIVDVAVKTLRPVKPGADANEYAAGEPLGAVVAVGSSVVGSDVIVAVRTFRRGPHFDGNLRLGFGRAYGETECSHSCQQQEREFLHICNGPLFLDLLNDSPKYDSTLKQRVDDKDCLFTNHYSKAETSPASFFSGRKYIAGIRTKIKNDAYTEM